MNLIQAALTSPGPHYQDLAQAYFLQEDVSLAYKFEKSIYQACFLTSLDPLTRKAYAGDVISEMLEDNLSDPSAIAPEALEWLYWICEEQDLSPDCELVDFIDLLCIFFDLQVDVHSEECSLKDDDFDNTLKTFMNKSLVVGVPHYLTKKLLMSDAMSAFRFQLSIELDKSLETFGAIQAIPENKNPPPGLDVKSWIESMPKDFRESIIEAIFTDNDNVFEYLLQDGNHTFELADNLLEFAKYQKLDSLKHYANEPDFYSDCASHSIDDDDIEAAIGEHLSTNERTPNELFDALFVLALKEFNEDDLMMTLGSFDTVNATDEQLLEKSVGLIRESGLFDSDSVLSQCYATAEERGAEGEMQEALDKYQPFGDYSLTVDSDDPLVLKIDIPKHELLAIILASDHLPDLLNVAFYGDSTIEDWLYQYDLLGSVQDLDVPYYGFSGFCKETLNHDVVYRLHEHFREEYDSNDICDLLAL